MRKTIAVLLALLLMLAMTACSGTKAPTPTQAPAPTAAPAPTEAPAPTDVPEPGDGLINLYIPAEFIGDMSEEDILANAEEMGVQEVYPQEDGSVVYVMTEEAHQKMLKELTDAIDQSLAELTEGEEAVASIRSINHDGDYSNFEFVIDRSVEDGAESLYALSLTLYGVYYQVYSGIPEPDCVVTLKDAVTGEVYDSVSYQDWLAFLEGFSDWGDDWGDWESSSNIQLPELEENVVLLDDAGVTVTAVGFQEEYFGPEMNLHIVNGTDQVVYVTCDCLIINGYATSGFLYTEVQPGEELDDTLTVYDSAMEILETEYIGEVTLQISANDEEYNSICTGDLITIRTTDYDEDWAKVPDSQLLFSGEGFKLSFVCTLANPYWEATDFYLLLENTGESIINVDCSGLLVNGIELFPWYYATAYPGSMCLSSISVDHEELEGAAPETVEAAFTVYDQESYESIYETDGYLSLPIGQG